MSQAQFKEQSHDTNIFKILIVNIGDHYFGALINSIEDIIQRNPTTPVPMADDNIIGVLNLRGHIVTEINVAKVLGINDSCKMNNVEGFSIVISKGQEMFSLLFEGVGDVIDIEKDEVEPLPATINKNWFQITKGVYRMQEKLIVILDFDQLIDSITPKNIT